MSSTKQMATVKCPKCGHGTELEVPQNSCLPAYKCESCNELIMLPKDSDNCCVVCEYSDDKCPISNKHK